LLYHFFSVLFLSATLSLSSIYSLSLHDALPILFSLIMLTLCPSGCQISCVSLPAGIAIFTTFCEKIILSLISSWLEPYGTGVLECLASIRSVRIQPQNTVRTGWCMTSVWVTTASSSKTFEVLPG